MYNLSTSPVSKSLEFAASEVGCGLNLKSALQ